MATRIQLATTPEELHQVFRLRHEVFVEEEGYMPPREDREVSDRYDHSERTLILMALVDGELAGTARLTLDGGLGTSADDYFDFTGQMVVARKQVGTGSQLCVHRRHRASRQLYSQLLGAFYSVASVFGMSHLKAVFNPEVGRLFAQAGWKPASDVFFSEKCGLPCLPMTLDLTELSLRFRNFVERHGHCPAGEPFVRQFHAAGETILGSGIDSERDGESYEIVSGSVTVTRVLADGTEAVERLGVGDTLAAWGSWTHATAVAMEPVELVVTQRAPVSAEAESTARIAA